MTQIISTPVASAGLLLIFWAMEAPSPVTAYWWVPQLINSAAISAFQAAPAALIIAVMNDGNSDGIKKCVHQRHPDR